MKLKVLGSGSSGNCYVLEDSKGKLLILECGLPFEQILNGIDYRIDDVIGCVITHSHGDHAKSIMDMYSNGIYIYASRGTIGEFPDIRMCIYVKHAEPFNVGEFRINPFDAIHDTPEPLNFIINHAEMGTMAFITDNGDVNVKLAGINHWLIEANHDEEFLKRSEMKDFMKNRITDNHLSIGQAVGIIGENDRSQLRNIVLCHLSETNANSERFCLKIAQIFSIMPKIAKKGLEVCLY